MNNFRPWVYLISPSQSLIEQMKAVANQLELIASAYDSFQDFSLNYDESTSGCILLCTDRHATETIDTIQQFTAKYAFAQFILCVSNWPVQDVVRAVKLGVSDVISFETETGRLRESIAHAIRRDRFNRSKLRLDIPQSIAEQLTSEESTIFNLMMQGKTTKQIGAELDLSVRTIHYRKKSIFAKLGVLDRNGAIEMVRRHRQSPTMPSGMNELTA